VQKKLSSRDLSFKINFLKRGNIAFSRKKNVLINNDDVSAMPVETELAKYAKPGHAQQIALNKQ